MPDRPLPNPLTREEDADLLKFAEHMWADLQANQLGGFSGHNRPFWIKWQIERAIEMFGSRDIGLTWTGDELAAIKRGKTGGS